MADNMKDMSGLSILISTYDYTCYKLVYDLHEQAEQLGIPYEIIVGEDGSKSPVNIIANHKITDLTHCIHHIRKENIGLAATRNELADMARYDWILFIDSDAVVDNDHYLATYMQHIGEAEAICGGLHHQAVNYDPQRTLRFKYETLADKQRDAATRSKNPYSQLSAFNLLLHRPAFMPIRFDKDCRDYGYEDALFGVELERRGVSMLHIDNPLLHSGLDTNESFLRKSETALRTLKGLNGRMAGRSHVENAYNKVRSLHLVWLVRLMFMLFKKPMRSNLLSKNPNLTILKLYKLGYYAGL